MADVLVILKIMPVSPQTDLGAVKKTAQKLIEKFGATLVRHEEQPIAFGLKALMVTILYDENKGSTDDLEEKIAALNTVESCSVTSVTRALG